MRYFPLNREDTVINYDGLSDQAKIDLRGWQGLLQQLLLDVEKSPDGLKIIGKYNVYFVKDDEFPRVNIDAPRKEL